MRGSLIWNSTAWSTADRLVGRWTNGILSTRAAAVATGFRLAAPTRALTSAAATRKTAAAPSRPAFLTRFSRARGVLDRLGDLRDELRQARPPPGGDVVV